MQTLQQRRNQGLAATLKQQALVVGMYALLAVVTAAVMALHFALVLARGVRGAAERLLWRTGVVVRTLGPL